MKKYHRAVDYLILAAALTQENKPNSAAKALLKATLVPGAKKALAELDADQQALQEAEAPAPIAAKPAVDVERAKMAKALARALSLSAQELSDENPFAKDDDDQDDDQDDDDDDDDQEESTVEEADNVDLENVSLEVEDTDGQLMRDTEGKPCPDTTKAATTAKALRSKIQARFAKKAAKK